MERYKNRVSEENEKKRKTEVLEEEKKYNVPAKKLKLDEGYA